MHVNFSVTPFLNDLKFKTCLILLCAVELDISVVFISLEGFSSVLSNFGKQPPLIQSDKPVESPFWKNLRGPSRACLLLEG